MTEVQQLWLSQAHHGHAVLLGFCRPNPYPGGILGSQSGYFHMLSSNKPQLFSEFCFLFCWVPSGKFYIAMEHHHFSWENPLFLWPFSIAMLVHQRVCWKTITVFGPNFARSGCGRTPKSGSRPPENQAYCWPVAGGGRDVVGIAKTGSGKTLATWWSSHHFVPPWMGSFLVKSYGYPMIIRLSHL